MKTLEIQAATGNSRLLVGERLQQVGTYLPDGPVVIITDTIVQAHYGDTFPKAPVITLGTGETAKTLAAVERIYGDLVEREADRGVFILGIGGGIVCDVTGFVASTYLRGVRFGFVSTTLLSQVDASVGGKNGQPEFVICDPAMLKTLPAHEVRSGFAEIIKHAAIGNAGLFDFLETQRGPAMALEPAAVERVVYDSVALKAAVVSKDEKEAGERRKLNFGHTLGHAIERTTGVSHGEAVSAGMVFAARLSAARGLLADADVVRLSSLIDAYGLPTVIDAPAIALIDALRHDKKRAGDEIHFVLLDRIGSAVVETIPIRELEEQLQKAG